MRNRHFSKKNLRQIVLAFALVCGFLLQPYSARASVDNVSKLWIGVHVAGNLLKIPYYRNYSLGDTNLQVIRAVVVIHGSGRNADDYYRRILDPAKRADNADQTTIIIAPQFLTESDISAHHLPADYLFWASSGWKKGDLSKSTQEHPRPARISSFAIIDSILQMLVTHNPNLHSIVIAGHSAGAQFVNRFAAGSRVPDSLSEQYGSRFRYIVANPSSYLYFNRERRVPGTIDHFQVPAASVIRACREFNRYKYGLEELNQYMGATGAAAIPSQYASREVIYLLGELDTDPHASSLDKTCPAILQGEYRLQRGMIYFNYLAHFFGAPIHAKHVIPGVGHSSTGIFASECGVFYLFDYGQCEGITAIGENRQTIPSHFSLRQNAPNPFSASTQIRFTLQQEARVSLGIFDVRGRKIAELLRSETIPAGSQQLAWNASAFPAGIYFARLRLDSGYTRSIKMLLIR